MLLLRNMGWLWLLENVVITEKFYRFCNLLQLYSRKNYLKYYIKFCLHKINKCLRIVDKEITNTGDRGWQYKGYTGCQGKVDVDNTKIFPLKMACILHRTGYYRCRDRSGGWQYQEYRLPKQIELGDCRRNLNTFALPAHSSL